MTFGVFQSYFQSHPPFENNRYIPVVGVLGTVWHISPQLRLQLTVWTGTTLPRKPSRHPFYDQIPEVPATYDMHRVVDLRCGPDF
jgi:hypothetical protein